MSGDPRVLMISGEYPPMEGGVADFTALLSGALAELGCPVAVLTDSAGRGGQPHGVKVFPWMDRWGWRALYDAVGRLRREWVPDVINVQYQTAAFDMHPAVNLLPRHTGGVPVVATFHDLKVPYLFPKAGPLRLAVNRRLARGAAASIVTNAEDAIAMSAWRGVRRQVTIPIGSNIPTTLPAGFDRAFWRRGRGLPDDALVICYFGFLNASKGGEELVAALDLLRDNDPPVYLLMVGGAVGASDPTNRAYLATVQAAIADRGLAGRVIWTGYLPPEGVSAALVSADVAVLPYRDGASFRRGSLMAALAHGLPIVSTWPRATVPELTHQKNIWLVMPGDAPGLAEAVRQLGTDPAVRARLAAGAGELAESFPVGTHCRPHVGGLS